MSKPKRHRFSRDVVHGVTEQGVNYGRGATAPLPDFFAPVDDEIVQIINDQGETVWSYTCPRSRCPVKQHSSRAWDESQARHALNQHLRDVHRQGVYT